MFGFCNGKIILFTEINNSKRGYPTFWTAPFEILKSNNSKIHRVVFPEHQLLQLSVRIDQLPREGEQAVNINTKVMKLKKVHLLSFCEDRSRQKTIPCSQ